MKIIAVETSSDICSIAYIVKGSCENIIEEKIPRQHAEKLPVFYSELIQQSEIQLSEIDAIAVSIGPGSFTGLRIGLSYSKGLAFSHRKPIIPVPTLQSLLYGNGIDGSDLAVVTHSHSDKYFIQKFKNNVESTDIDVKICTSANDLKIDLKRTRIVQYGCDQLFKPANSEVYNVQPSAKWIGELAHKNYKEWIAEEPYKLVPEYISPFKIGG